MILLRFVQRWHEIVVRRTTNFENSASGKPFELFSIQIQERNRLKEVFDNLRCTFRNDEYETHKTTTETTTISNINEIFVAQKLYASR